MAAVVAVLDAPYPTQRPIGTASLQSGPCKGLACNMMTKIGLWTNAAAL